MGRNATAPQALPARAVAVLHPCDFRYTCYRPRLGGIVRRLVGYCWEQVGGTSPAVVHVARELRTLDRSIVASPPAVESKEAAVWPSTS